MAEILYPDGYGTTYVTMAQMKAKYGPKFHPEFAARFFAFIESCGGKLGVGQGWRAVQPDKPGFAPPGRSFHETQRFASGINACCAVDLVRPDGPDGNHVHDGVTWQDTIWAPHYGLHTFIGRSSTSISDDEPWHIQPIEITGWETWVVKGRPDPIAGYDFPGRYPPPKPTTPKLEIQAVYDKFEQAAYNFWNRWDTRAFGKLKAGQYGVAFQDWGIGKKAIKVNVKVHAPVAAGYATVWKGDSPTPDNLSQLDFAAGQTVNNELTIPLAADGTFKIYISQGADLIIDLIGYYS